MNQYRNEEVLEAFRNWHKRTIEILKMNQEMLEAGEYYLMQEAFDAGAEYERLKGENSFSIS